MLKKNKYLDKFTVMWQESKQDNKQVEYSITKARIFQNRAFINAIF